MNTLTENQKEKIRLAYRSLIGHRRNDNNRWSAALEVIYRRARLAYFHDLCGKPMPPCNHRLYGNVTADQVLAAVGVINTQQPQEVTK